MEDVLEYGSGPSRLRAKRIARRAAIVVAAVACFAALAAGERRDEGKMDAVTGSLSKRTVWPFGLTTGWHVERSALEERLAQRHIAWTPNWYLLYQTERSLIGLSETRGCGLAPPILQLRAGLKNFAQASTDQELRDFVKVMQTAPEPAQRAAVEAASEKVFSRQ